MKTLIFDIDGTLVESYDFDSVLYRRAVLETLGDVHVHDDWSRYVHVTDAGILAQIVEENGVLDRSAIDAVRERFVDLVEDHLRKEPCRPIRGAVEMFADLSASADRQVGVATGGWRRSALAKLESAGFDLGGIPLASSDDAVERTEIMRHCVRAMRRPPDSVTYVGDGVWDQRAAKALGWDLVAIGPRLEGRHSPWILDFEDPVWLDVRRHDG